MNSRYSYNTRTWFCNHFLTDAWNSLQDQGFHLCCLITVRIYYRNSIFAGWKTAEYVVLFFCDCNMLFAQCLYFMRYSPCIVCYAQIKEMFWKLTQAWSIESLWIIKAAFLGRYFIPRSVFCFVQSNGSVPDSFSDACNVSFQILIN